MQSIAKHVLVLSLILIMNSRASGTEEVTFHVVEEGAHTVLQASVEGFQLLLASHGVLCAEGQNKRALNVWSWRHIAAP